MAPNPVWFKDDRWWFQPTGRKDVFGPFMTEERGWEECRAYYGRKRMTDKIHPTPAEFTAEEIATDDVLRYFHYSHLPEMLQAKSKPFCELARLIIDSTPRCPQRTIALNKLLEAKDAAVRAGLPPA